LRLEMGQAARRKVEKEFNIANVPQQFQKILL